MIKRRSIKKLIRAILPKYGEFTGIIIKNRLNKALGKHNNQKNTFLFILSPPYCGSTLLNELISTSKAVSVNNPFGTREGQWLPSVRQIMFDNLDVRWKTDASFDWQYIKNEWLKYWDLSKPILLEKSPPNIARAVPIANTFSPAYFIIFHRNPYAHCESLIRRNEWDISSAAEFAIMCLNLQKENIIALNDNNTIQISYEFLTENTAEAVGSIQKVLPELLDIDFTKNFSAHNYLEEKKMKIRNLNEDKINKLSPIQISEINKVFTKHQATMDFFSYSLIEPS